MSSPTEHETDGHRQPGPHSGAIRASAGTALAEAHTAVVMLHGRGDSAAGILGLAEAFDAPGTAFVAPQATSNAWYPHPFMSELHANQPWLDSALMAVDSVVATVVDAGIAHERIVLLGFSQGACLASEYVARNGRRYGGVVALSGGLIGPQVEAARYLGALAGTPAFFGCSDVDPHIPLDRVSASADLYRDRGAAVEQRTYPGFGHNVNQDEVDWVQALLTGLASRGD
ncbi:MAG TPA: dienelactone hydrolase family protein [Trueperaceae bacterium]|nr:dienelactone hydrolase family protein [Trueperaceae bacterium]